MFKMLIVEDERWEREGLVDFLDWNSFNIDVVETACDGIEGMEQALKIRPDIIITDIKMPGMDGIVMSKKIKERLPNTKIIILTGYDDFKYAKEAVSFNANGYILKNFEEEEMIQVVQKVVDECEQEKQRTESENSIESRLNESLCVVKAAFFSDLLEGKYAENEQLQQFIDFGIDGYADDEYIAVVVKVQDKESGRIAAEFIYQNEKASEMSRILENMQNIFVSNQVFLLENAGLGETTLCFRNLYQAEDSLKLKMKAIAEQTAKKYGTGIVIGIGDRVTSIYNIRQSYVQARQIIEFSAFWRIFGVLTFRQVDLMHRDFFSKASEFLVQGSYYSKQLVHAIRYVDEDRALLLMNEMFEHIRTSIGASREYIVNYLQNTINEISILIYQLNKDFEQENDEEYLIQGTEYLPDLESIEGRLNIYVKRAIAGISGKRLSKDEQITKKVLKLIDERYFTDISLKVLASEVFLSPNYLGMVFKKYTGKSINDYICEYRMEKAKELLKSPEKKINWIAAKVGIPNTSYFCTTFKNTYGMAPGEYQKMILENPVIHI